MKRLAAATTLILALSVMVWAGDIPGNPKEPPPPPPSSPTSTTSTTTTASPLQTVLIELILSLIVRP